MSPPAPPVWGLSVASIWLSSLYSTQLHDFAQLNENIFYIYNDIEYFKDEPQKISITCEEDIHVTEEVYKRPMFTMPGYRLFTQFLYYLLSAGVVSDTDTWVAQSCRNQRAGSGL